MSKKVLNWKRSKQYYFEGRHVRVTHLTSWMCSRCYLVSECIQMHQTAQRPCAHTRLQFVAEKLVATNEVFSLIPPKCKSFVQTYFDEVVWKQSSLAIQFSFIPAITRPHNISYDVANIYRQFVVRFSSVFKLHHNFHWQNIQNTQLAKRSFQYWQAQVQIHNPTAGLIDWVKVWRSTQHKIGRLEDVPPTNLWA